MPHFETNITTDGDIILNGNQKEGDVVAAGGVFTGGAAQATTYSLHVGGKAKVDTISNATSDTDKFLVSDSGEIKYRTGTQLVSDLGAVSGFAYLPLAGNTTSTRMTGEVYFTNLIPIYWRNSANTANTFAMLNDANDDMFLINQTGGRHIDIINQATDGDIIFRADSGNGTETEYFRLDGSQASTGSALYTRWPDKSRVTLGDSNDLQLYHDSTNSKIENETGQLRIINNAVDKSLMFQATSDGSGSNVTESYLSLLPSFGSGAVFIYKDFLMAQDDTKIKLGASQDLEIYHDGSNSYIDDTGTGWIKIRGNGGVLLESYSEGETMIKASRNASVELYHNNNKKFETSFSGGTLTGALTVTGDVLDRDVPCLFNSNFLDGTSSSIFVVPFNTTKEVTVSSKIYEHYLTMPYAGKLVKIIMKNASGSLGSGFTTQLFLYVNGSQQASSAELSISNSAITWTPTSNNTFSAGDLLTFAYQKSASGTGVTWAGVSFGVAIELTDYDI
jgi:hypothetical protein